MKNDRSLALSDILAALVMTALCRGISLSRPLGLA
jgi:hypothetical protein